MKQTCLSTITISVMALRKGTICYIFTTLLIICCEGSFYLNTDESNWSNAHSKCTPATPDIVFHKNKYNLKIDDLEWKNAGSAWTGFYKVTMAFEYIGCAELRDISKLNTTEHGIDKDPSQCFPRCSMTDTVGVTEKKCYCLRSLPPNISTIQDGCEANDCGFGVACGGKKDHVKYVSMYKANPEVETEQESSGTVDADSAEKSCLSVKNGAHKWEECSKELTCICYKADNTVTGRDFLGPWFKAAKFCFSKREYPVRYSDALSFQTGDTQVWTGVFKMDIILSQNWKGHEKEVERYGFTQKDKQKYILRFTGDDSNKAILCNQDGKDKTVPDSNELKKITTQPETTGQPQPDTNMDSGTAFGICVAVALAIIAVIVAVVYLRKRFINSHRFDKMSESSVTGPDHEYNYPNYAFCREPEPTSPEQSVRNNTDGTEYNYLDFSVQNADNTLQNADISETGNSAVVANIKINPYSYESAYKVSSDYSGEDITCSKNKVNPKTQGLGEGKINNYAKLGGNSYDVLGKQPTFETGKTYDTTAVQESSASATNTYDTSLPSSGKLKQSQGGFTDNIYVANSDTYNHLGSEKEQTQTDQLYGMKQVAKFKHILKPEGNENIYNTTSGQAEANTVTDNPYAKLGQ